MILNVFILRSIRSIDQHRMESRLFEPQAKEIVRVIGRFKQIGGKIIVLFCRREVRFRLKLSGISEN